MSRFAGNATILAVMIPATALNPAGKDRPDRPALPDLLEAANLLI
jgi:hypothetical protein